MKVIRLPNNPIITPNMPGLRFGKANNINGPTLIRVPNWVNKPLGKYYLYFAHHKGKYIRLAYANFIAGPYTIYKPGVLHINELTIQTEHIGSPEIFIDFELKKIRLYFHLAVKGEGIYSDQHQMSFCAESTDGIHFNLITNAIAPFYLRVFRYQNYFYGIVKNDNKNGILLRSPDGVQLFERGSEFCKDFRHCALLLRQNKLFVFYTRVGDVPESILLSEIDLARDTDWRKWKLLDPILVLKPEFEWEGSKLPLTKSKHGSTKPMNALRDPFVFEEEGKSYLLYSVKGESGIGIAELEGL
jgi:hypothetical protein